MTGERRALLLHVGIKGRFSLRTADADRGIIAQVMGCSYHVVAFIPKGRPRRCMTCFLQNICRREYTVHRPSGTRHRAAGIARPDVISLKAGYMAIHPWLACPPEYRQYSEGRLARFMVQTTRITTFHGIPVLRTSPVPWLCLLDIVLKDLGDLQIWSLQLRYSSQHSFPAPTKKI